MDCDKGRLIWWNFSGHIAPDTSQLQEWPVLMREMSQTFSTVGRSADIFTEVVCLFTTEYVRKANVPLRGNIGHLYIKE